MRKANSALLWFGILLCAIPLSAAGTGTTPLSLVLKSRATVSDDIVRVNDVALMKPNVRARIGGLVIAVSPQMGKSTTIYKKEIHEKLVGNGFTISTDQLKGPSAVTIMRKGQLVKPSVFKEEILKYITKHSRWKDGISISITSNKQIVVPENGVRWKLTPANGQDFFGNVLFKVRGYSPTTNEEIISNWIVAKLKITKQVAVSNGTINKNQLITENDIRWETREITVFTKDAIWNKHQLVGQKAGRLIRPNSVITTTLLQKKYMVRRGSIVKLFANFKGIIASSTVKALANGTQGDTIRVQNINSKKILSAVVSGPNKLEVIVE
jgi:flagellar basal body P-ring formation protein FlgA